MADFENRPVLRVPSREIPVPAHLSLEAQAALAKGPLAVLPDYPSPDDLAGWRAMVAAVNAQTDALANAQMAAIEAHSSEIHVDDARVFVSRPQRHSVDEEAVYLDIHGGAFIVGGGEICRMWGAGLAAMLGASVWSVDYRMPPDHPYPAGLDDCVAAYRAILKKHPPEKVVVGGLSAGGNLAAALILRARDEGLPLPAGAVLRTPELDLTESGDSFYTNLGVDTVCTRHFMPVNLLYANGHDLRHPYLSPLFGDFSKGFPPTLIAAGTRDLFLSNAVRMHRALRKADVPAELYVMEAAPHAGFHTGFEPVSTLEDEDLDGEVRRFAHRLWAHGH